MSLDVDEQRDTASHHHPARWWWFIAGTAAVVVVAVVVAVVLWLRSDDSESPASRAGDAAHPGVAPVRTLQIPVSSGRCLVPSAAMLASRPIAFEGRVSNVGDNSATLIVTSTFAGHVADTVVVGRPPRTTEPGLTLTPGRTYLMAASPDGTVAACGFSGERTPALARLYAAAFGG